MAVSKISDERLYVALDLPSIEQARAMVETLGDSVESYKIGLQLLPLGGAEFGQELKAMGKNVFYDFKLHDIGATVEKATRSISGLGADLLTVHARPGVTTRKPSGTALRILLASNGLETTPSIPASKACSNRRMTRASAVSW